MRRGTVVALLLAGAALTGCAGSPVASVHTLGAVTPVPATPVPAVDFSVSVGPVSVPDAVDRPELVLTVAPNRTEVQELHHWAAPLKGEIARVVAENLARIYGPERVWPDRSAPGAADYRVLIEVRKFESVPGRTATIDAKWTVRGAGGELKSGTAIMRRGVLAEGVDGVVAAHSGALDAMSRDIAGVIWEMHKERH